MKTFGFYVLASDPINFKFIDVLSALLAHV
jgi:hypothetical protein